jgi:hypothetical protein
MAYYVWVKSVNEPADVLGLDDAGRIQYSFNVNARKESSDTFLEEVVKVLVSAGIGILNTSIFASSKAKLPTSPTALFLTLRETGGAPPYAVHNQTSPPLYVQPSLMVVVHGPDTAPTKAKARAAYNALVAVKNQTITP